MTNHVDEQYLDLLDHILWNGTNRGDRTGTGTRSVFGYQMRFDLTKGFPLLTTKKLWTRAILEELVWFLSGSTDASKLPQDVQKWWTPWADETGQLGPIYGAQMRSSRYYATVTPKLFDPPDVESQPGLFCGVGHTLEVPGTRPPLDDVDRILKNVWRDMLKRCYDTEHNGYDSYGGKGVHVDPEWLHYDAFKRDAQKLEGWELKREYPDVYSLDKDILHASNRYSRDTCLWASRVEQSMNTSTNMPFTATSPSGVVEIFTSIGEMQRTHGVNMSAVHRCLRGLLHTHHGWHSFQYITVPDGTVMRFRELDQLANVIAMIKHNPNSRRIMMNLWHSPAMTLTGLPCCHGSVVQFYVANGKLSCHMYQRSGDAFIGVPVNIASYAFLVHAIAHVTGLGVGDFVHSFGDVHIYNNHIEQVKTQLSRRPHRELPVVTMSGFDRIEDFRAEHVTITGYDPHPAISAPIAV